MKDIFKRPTVFYRAQTKKGLNIVFEILVFYAVIFVGSIAKDLFMVPYYTIILFNSPNFKDFVLNPSNLGIKGDLKSYAVQQATAPTTINIFLNRISTIMFFVIVMLFIKYIQKRDLGSLGFQKKNVLKEYLIGALAGFIMFSIAVLFCVTTGSVKLTGYSLQDQWFALLVFLIGYMINGMSLEVMLRGYFCVSVARRYSLIVAIITNSAVYALMNINNEGVTPLAIVNVFLFGVFASIYFIKRGSIWGIAAFHSIWSFSQTNFYGIGISGADNGSSLFSTVFAPGREILNGGAYGLEGGLGVTIVLVIGIQILCFMNSNKVELVNCETP